MAKLLEGGLLLQTLREGGEAHIERYREFFYYGFDGTDTYNPEENGTVLRDLILHHPATTLDDFFYIVDPAANGKIVSGVAFIPQTWRYGGIEFGLGRMEPVATLPDYRRRGLVRELINAAHQRSEALGHLAQGITGIPYFYRQFGYGMAVDLGRAATLNLVDIDDSDDEPRFTLRPATLADIPQIMAIDEYDARQCTLSAVRDEAIWQFDIEGRQSPAVKTSVMLIVNADDEPVGHIFYEKLRDDSERFNVLSILLGENANYIEVFPDLLCGLKKHMREESEKAVSISFPSHIHPTLRALLRRKWGAWLPEHVWSWYLRIPDLGKFIMRIAPVLEARLVNSGARNYTGTVTIGFYNRKRLKIVFDDGRITEATHQPLDKGEKTDGNYPFDLFYNILFGHRTHDEIRYVVTDANLSNEVATLFDILFPKQHASLIGIQ